MFAFWALMAPLSAAFVATLERFAHAERPLLTLGGAEHSTRHLVVALIAVLVHRGWSLQC
jgi:hypothetical protein